MSDNTPFFAAASLVASGSAVSLATKNPVGFLVGSCAAAAFVLLYNKTAVVPSQTNTANAQLHNEANTKDILELNETYPIDADLNIGPKPVRESEVRGNEYRRVIPESEFSLMPPSCGAQLLEKSLNFCW